jgi:putative sigma-54 modulation protein
MHNFFFVILRTLSMKITIKGTNIELTPELREYIMEKFGALERYFQDSDPDTVVADVEIGKPSQHHRKGDVYLCEINVRVGGTLLRAEELRSSIHEAVDLVRDEIERQARRLKSKRRAQFLRRARKVTRAMKYFRFGRKE